MRRTTSLGPRMRPVCRLGLATRGGSRLRAEDVEWAISRGTNYLNWCGHPDGLSHAIRELGVRRREVVIAVQFQARSEEEAEREFASLLEQLGTDYLDVATLYYVESQAEWEEITGRGGSWHTLERMKQGGALRMIGLTSHQRRLAAKWARSGMLDLLMIRYNAAHRGAEEDVFPVTAELGMPAVTFTGLRWRALLEPTPDDPPDFRPPRAADCYRFCLANPRVSVALAAAGNRAELEQNLALLDDWRAPSQAEMRSIRSHGDRVHKHAAVFW